MVLKKRVRGVLAVFARQKETRFGSGLMDLQINGFTLLQQCVDGFKKISKSVIAYLSLDRPLARSERCSE